MESWKPENDALHVCFRTSSLFKYETQNPWTTKCFSMLQFQWVLGGFLNISKRKKTTIKSSHRGEGLAKRGKSCGSGPKLPIHMVICSIDPLFKNNICIYMYVYVYIYIHIMNVLVIVCEWCTFQSTTLMWWESGKFITCRNFIFFSGHLRPTNSSFTVIEKNLPSPSHTVCAPKKILL